ncbi:MAG: hypothetical protein QF489_08770 [Planctomycetota bacterium]|nr:hypothetical protein [Planctomycetota bacterium]
MGFTDSNYGQGFIHARIHYPALSAGQGATAANNSGPFPVVALMHGWLGSADGLDMIGNHMASHGYLVASIDTHSGLFPDTMDYARNTRAMLQWAEDQSNTPGSWLDNMARLGDWAAVGHSMGGGTLSLLIGIEPRVRVIVGMQAADADPLGTTNMNNYTGAGMWIAGSVDNIVPPLTVRRWYDRATLGSRRSYFNVIGMGHVGPTDTVGNGDPMPGAEQQAVHRRLITPFLDAELRGDEGAYEFIYGSSVDDPWTMSQSSLQPILWGGRAATSTSAEFGLHGMPFASAVFAWSTALGSTVTPFGLADLDLVAGGQTPVFGLGPLGWGRDDFTFPPLSSGTTFYFQAAAFQGSNGALTRSFGVTVP